MHLSAQIHFIRLMYWDSRAACMPQEAQDIRFYLQNYSKGVFPREPKKKVEGNHNTYYHMKGIAFLAHDPLIEKFRYPTCLGDLHDCLVMVHLSAALPAIEGKREEVAQANDVLMNSFGVY